MDVKDIKKVLEAVADAEISELVLETGDYKLTVKRDYGQAHTPAAPVAVSPPPAPVETTAHIAEVLTDSSAPAPATPSLPANTHEVTAPIVGTFYAASSPDADDFVKVGDQVDKGAVLCIIEAMKLMNEIEAEVSGQVMEIVAENGEPVEYGQTLMWINPE